MLLKGKIAELDDQAKQTHELEEDRELKKLEAEYDELDRQYEEKTEKIAIAKA